MLVNEGPGHSREVIIIKTYNNHNITNIGIFDPVTYAQI